MGVGVSVFRFFRLGGVDVKDLVYGLGGNGGGKRDGPGIQGNEVEVEVYIRRRASDGRGPNTDDMV